MADSLTLNGASFGNAQVINCISHYIVALDRIFLGKVDGY
jgi:hypothetical protein